MQKLFICSVCPPSQYRTWLVLTGTNRGARRKCLHACLILSIIVRWNLICSGRNKWRCMPKKNRSTLKSCPLCWRVDCSFKVGDKQYYSWGKQCTSQLTPAWRAPIGNFLIADQRQCSCLKQPSLQTLFLAIYFVTRYRNKLQTRSLYTLSSHTFFFCTAK